MINLYQVMKECCKALYCIVYLRINYDLFNFPSCFDCHLLTRACENAPIFYFILWYITSFPHLMLLLCSRSGLKNEAQHNFLTVFYVFRYLMNNSFKCLI